MAYVQSSDGVHPDPQLGGIFGTIGGAFKKAGSFVAKKVAPTAISFVPIVGGAASAAYSSIPGIRDATPTAATPGITAPRESWTQRLARFARERIAGDAALREQVIERLSRTGGPQVLPPDVVREIARRRAIEAARGAPTAVKAGLTAGALLPAIAIAGLVIRARRS